MEQISSAPTNKVVMGTIAGALTIVLVWILHQFVKIDVPPEVASSITVLVTALVSYAVPPAARDRIQQNP